MKFYVSTAFLDTREAVEIARAADDLGYHGMAIPDHATSREKALAGNMAMQVRKAPSSIRKPPAMALGPCQRSEAR